MADRKPMTQGKRFSIFRRDNFACRYCGRSSPDVVLHVEHVTPVTAGGSDRDENLVTSCADCNNGKGVLRGVEPPALASCASSAPEGLAGLFLHTVDTQGELLFQGRVVRRLNSANWIVEFFSFADGSPGPCEVIPERLLVGKHCRLYTSPEIMQAEYEKYAARWSGPRGTAPKMSPPEARDCLENAEAENALP